MRSGISEVFQPKGENDMSYLNNNKDFYCVYLLVVSCTFATEDNQYKCI